MRLLPLLSLLTTLAVSPASAQEGADRIRLNQVGFYPGAPKAAVVVDVPEGPFHVVHAEGADTVYTGTLGTERFWSASGERVRQADFSALEQPGTYAVHVPGIGASYPFEVSGAAHRPVAAAALKGFYYQRTGTPLLAEHAGTWARPAGHPDTAVRVHASAATAERPTDTVISAPRGWYDAGDFNKYVVNSGISTYTLLALYEHYPAFAAGLNVGIPESGDGVPDVLDEALWNVRWMMAMQDPDDGGVYHKLTHANFQGAVMPHTVRATRYVVQKGTAATLDVAAVAAQAARIFAGFEGAFPGLSDSLRTAALDAWGWARRHPGVAYNQQALNQRFNPDINTGEYGDQSFDDEFAWAAAELSVTTGADSFLTIASPLGAGADVPWWGGVRTLGWYTLLHHRHAVAAAVDTSALKQRYLAFAHNLRRTRAQTPYGVVMGQAAWHFGWGSNSGAANQGMALLQAYRVSGDSTYLWDALSNLDYLLGRNATGFSFVTGHGNRTPMHPHHRVSEADRIAAPVPGLLAGGPNPAQQDGCTYASNLPARSYVDDWCSYASNEIAINWNAPLVYLAGGLEATLAEGTSPSSRAPDAPRGGQALLLPPYPNPAAQHTTLSFDLAAPSLVRVEAFDLLGRRVAGWSDRAYPSGLHRLAWSLDALPPGTYFVRLSSGDHVAMRSVVKLPL